MKKALSNLDMRDIVVCNCKPELKDPISFPANLAIGVDISRRLSSPNIMNKKSIKTFWN